MSYVTTVFSQVSRRLFFSQGPIIQAEPQRVILTAGCLAAIDQGIAEERNARHESIVYLLGLTNGTTTLVVGAVRPAATTTTGSFDVTSGSMAAVIRSASKAGLHMVGQLHTHPGAAYHSAGDETGARIRFPGFTSIVVPGYGDRLLDLKDVAVYVVNETGRFREIDGTGLTVLPPDTLWRM